MKIETVEAAIADLNAWCDDAYILLVKALAIIDGLWPAGSCKLKPCPGCEEWEATRYQIAMFVK